MTDHVSPEKRSRIMQTIRSSHTKLENVVANELWRRGLRIRRNVKSLPGKPDIAIKKIKTVVFIDSCFWHGCSVHFKIPKSNSKYWEEKINTNKLRDQLITNYYIQQGWRILRVWEHEIKANPRFAIQKIQNFILESYNST